MRRRTRIHYTDSQKSQMWDRWQRGESLQKIARLFDRHHSAVRGILLVSGGIRPPVRHRSPRSLTLAEREVISRGLVHRVFDPCHGPVAEASAIDHQPRDRT